MSRYPAVDHRPHQSSVRGIRGPVWLVQTEVVKYKIHTRFQRLREQNVKYLINNVVY